MTEEAPAAATTRVHVGATAAEHEAAAATPGRSAVEDTDTDITSTSASQEALNELLNGQAPAGGNGSTTCTSSRPSGASSPLNVPVPSLEPPAPESGADDVGMPIEVDDDRVRSTADGEHSGQQPHRSPPMTALSIMRRDRERSMEDYPLDDFVGSCDEADSATTPNPPFAVSSQISELGQCQDKQQDQQGGVAAPVDGGNESSVAAAAQDGSNQRSDLRPPMTHSMSVGSVGSTSSAVLGALGVLDRSSSRHNGKGGGGRSGAGPAGNQGVGSSSSSCSSKARRSSRKVLDRPRSSSWASFDDYGGYSSGERSTGSGHSSVRKKREKKHAKERERKERVVESYHQHYGGTRLSTTTLPNIVGTTTTSLPTSNHPPAAPARDHNSACPPLSQFQLQQQLLQLIVDPTDDAAGRPTTPPPPPPSLPSQAQPHDHREQQDNTRHQLRQQHRQQQHHNQEHSSTRYSPPLSFSAQQCGQFLFKQQQEQQQQYQQNPPYHSYGLHTAPSMAAGHHYPEHSSIPAPHRPYSVLRPRSPGNRSWRRRLDEARCSGVDNRHEDDSDSDEGDHAGVRSRQTQANVRTKTPLSVISAFSRKHDDVRHQQYQSQTIGSWPLNCNSQQSFLVERGYSQGYTPSSCMYYTLKQQEGPHGELVMPSAPNREQQQEKELSSQAQGYHLHPPQYGARSSVSSPTYYSEAKGKRAVEVANYSNIGLIATNHVGPISQTYAYDSYHQSEMQRLSKRRSSVSFSTIEIRSYERILGDNPSCSHGPAVSIGWQYEPDPITVQVDEFEYYRAGDRLDGTALVLTRSEREEILEDLGYTRAAIADAVRTNVKVKNNRRQTVHNLAVARLEEAAESAKRKLKRFLLGRKKEKNDTCAPSSTPIRSGDEIFTRKSSLRTANFTASPAAAPAKRPGPALPSDKMLSPEMIAHPAPLSQLQLSHPPVQYQDPISSTGAARHLKQRPVIASEENSLPLEVFDSPSIGMSSQAYAIDIGSMAYDPQHEHGQHSK